MTTDEQAIEEVTKALRQVISVKPQLLFKASQKLFSDLTIEVLALECEEVPNRTKIEAFHFRTALCLWLGKVLITSGKAHLDKDDFLNIGAFLEFIR